MHAMFGKLAFAGPKRMSGTDRYIHRMGTNLCIEASEPTRSFVSQGQLPPSAGGGAFLAAVAEWERALGAQHVCIDESARDRYGRTTSPHGNRPLGILRPDSAEQVARIVTVATQYGIGVHPISRGKNWGYGDACPPGKDQVIIDLGRMNRIIELNEELCYVVIEPGVTQGQLYVYLQERKAKLWMDCTGAGPDASIVGNTLDRGFGHTRYGDRFLTSCGMEVVLADGRILNTGFGHYPNAKPHRTYRYGVGPFLDGIFSQSNFGIVTQMGVWLMPEPEAFSAFFFSAPNEQDLADLIDRLAPLRMQGVLQSTIHIANDLRVMSGRMRYPFERAGGITPLPPALRAQLRKEVTMGAWSGCGAIYGTKETVAATCKAVARALKGYGPKFINDKKLRKARSVVNLLQRFGMGQRLAEQLKTVAPVYGLLKGIPTDDPLRGASWRVRGPAPEEPVDPLDNHAGLMWIAPALPATGKAADDLMKRMEPIYSKYGFDTLVTFTMITERALCCVTNIAFDRREADEVSRAQACYEELSQHLMKNGYIPYRCAPSGFTKLATGSSTFWEVAAQIKHALDPEGIISPGRYQPAA
jgi:4-cresol dehydrogenase (hydroxylating)